MTLQLMATGIYYLYFVVMKLFPHYSAMKADLIPLFTNSLLELKGNFNPRPLREHTVDTTNINSMLTFVQNLQDGYTNPYNPEMPLPETPQFDPRELRAALRNFRKLPAIPTYIPKIVYRGGNNDNDNDSNGDGKKGTASSGHKPVITPAVIPSLERFEEFNDAIVAEEEEETINGIMDIIDDASAPEQQTPQAILQEEFDIMKREAAQRMKDRDEKNRQ